MSPPLLPPPSPPPGAPGIGGWVDHRHPPCGPTAAVWAYGSAGVLGMVLGTLGGCFIAFTFLGNRGCFGPPSWGIGLRRSLKTTGDLDHRFGAYRGGEHFGRGESHGENFGVQKSGELSPPAKSSRRMTNNFTANSDGGEYREFRNVQPCTRRREGTKMCLFPTCGGCVTGMQWNAVLPRILKVPTRK